MQQTSPRPSRCSRPAKWKSADSSASRSHSRSGAIAASSVRTSSENDTLELQEPPLVAGAERAVRAEPVRADDAVAGHDDPEAVRGADRADAPAARSGGRRARRPRRRWPSRRRGSSASPRPPAAGTACTSRARARHRRTSPRACRSTARNRSASGCVSRLRPPGPWQLVPGEQAVREDQLPHAPARPTAYAICSTMPPNRRITAREPPRDLPSAARPQRARPRTTSPARPSAPSSRAASPR